MSDRLNQEDIGSACMARRQAATGYMRPSRFCISRTPTEKFHHDPRQQCQSTHKPNGVKIRPSTIAPESTIKQRTPMTNQQRPNTIKHPRPIYWQTRSVSPAVPRKMVKAIIATKKKIISVNGGYHV